VTPAGQRHRVGGRRAPSLRRASLPRGADRAALNGKDLAGWTTFGGTSQWSAAGGVLKNAKSGANLVTTAKYDDFKLHLEVNCRRAATAASTCAPLRGAGGGRGRPRAQVDRPGGVYGFLVPNENATAGAGNWQTFDITLVAAASPSCSTARRSSATRRSRITGGALDSDEGAPGPIYLQGDHGAVAYRNLRITPAVPAK